MSNHHLPLSPSDQAASLEEWDTIIRSRREAGLDLLEFWAYRELLYFLAWRNLKVRYKQTILGAAWAVLQPFMTMVVFSIFFGRLAGIPSDGVPYPVFAYAALVPWTYFANSLGQAANSLVEHESMLTKVYFPRLFLPLAPLLSNLVDALIATAILLLLMVAYGVEVQLTILLFPLFLLLAAVTALGAGLLLAALNVQYRDVRYVISFLIQFWLFATPVVYPSSLLEERWQVLYGLNPMAGVVEGSRWALLGQPEFPGGLLLTSLLAAALLTAGGLLYFLRMEARFADVV